MSVARLTFDEEYAFLSEFKKLHPGKLIQRETVGTTRGGGLRLTFTYSDGLTLVVHSGLRLRSKARRYYDVISRKERTPEEIKRWSNGPPESKLDEVYDEAAIGADAL